MPLHRYNMFQAPLAESVGTIRKSPLLTSVMGLAIYGTAMAILIVAAVTYSRQIILVQTSEVLPLAGASCVSTNSPTSERMYDFNTNLLITYSWTSRVSEIYGGNITECIGWLNDTLKVKNDGVISPQSGLPDLMQFNMDGEDCVVPPSFTINVYSPRTSNLTAEVYNKLVSQPHPCILTECEDTLPWGSPGSSSDPGSVNLRDAWGNTGRQIMMSDCLSYLIQQNKATNTTQLATGDVTAASLRREAPAPTFGTGTPTYPYDTTNSSEYWLYYMCRGDPRMVPSPVSYTGTCQTTRLVQGFQSPIVGFCNTAWRQLNGPYLCTVQSSRNLFDIVNLSFAAGSTATLFLMVVLRPVHRFINPAVQVQDMHMHGAGVGGATRGGKGGKAVQGARGGQGTGHGSSGDQGTNTGQGGGQDTDADQADGTEMGIRIDISSPDPVGSVLQLEVPLTHE